jgi:hypothetical protein
VLEGAAAVDLNTTVLQLGGLVEQEFLAVAPFIGNYYENICIN